MNIRKQQQVNNYSVNVSSKTLEGKKICIIEKYGGYSGPLPEVTKEKGMNLMFQSNTINPNFIN